MAEAMIGLLRISIPQAILIYLRQRKGHMRMISLFSTTLFALIGTGQAFGMRGVEGTELVKAPEHATSHLTHDGVQAHVPTNHMTDITPLSLVWGASTLPGIDKHLNKPKNYSEDRFVGYHNGPKDIHILFVADGHGGKMAANYLLKNLAETITEALTTLVSPTNELIITALKEAYRKLDESLLKLYPKMVEHLPGSTAAALILWKNLLITANVGDSGITIRSPDGATWSTPRHTHANLDERQRVLHDGGIFKDEGRLGGIFIPTRSFGDHIWGKKPTGLTAEPEIRIEPAIKGTTALICTDGIYDYLGRKQLLELLESTNSEFIEKKASPKEIASVIVNGLRELAFACYLKSEYGFDSIDDATAIAAHIR